MHKPYLLRFRVRDSAMAAATASHLLMPPIRCSDSKPTRRGFGTKNNTNKVPTYVLYLYIPMCFQLSICVYVSELQFSLVLCLVANKMLEK